VFDGVVVMRHVCLPQMYMRFSEMTAQS
jgi:hypothetical protein